MLSLVDLVEAGTLPVETSAILAWIASQGGSFLTSAGPGGVGKTTLLGACLAFLPSSTEIVTVDSRRVLERPGATHPECLLIHEINNASYYGYLWGPEIGRFFAMAGRDRCVAATIHAEGYAELRRKLARGPLGVREDDVDRVEVVAFMAVRQSRRLVTSLWLAGVEVMRHEAERDIFVGEPESSVYDLLARRNGETGDRIASGVERWRTLIEEAQRKEIRRMELLRHLARRRIG
jgi:type IV secretory pathway ATPase VirB11/archaellum biosynthesis ATPase